jgi:hypothetical protein
MANYGNGCNGSVAGINETNCNYNTNLCNCGCENGSVGGMTNGTCGCNGGMVGAVTNGGCNCNCNNSMVGNSSYQNGLVGGVTSGNCTETLFIIITIALLLLALFCGN